jgi:hypothetical protein
MNLVEQSIYNALVFTYSAMGQFQIIVDRDGSKSLWVWNQDAYDYEFVKELPQ